MDSIITHFNLPSISAAVGLAAVATIGYLAGLRSRRKPTANESSGNVAVAQPRASQRTAIVAKELESIAEQLRRRIAEHHRSVATFQNRVTAFCQSRPQSEWVELARDAQDILQPTIKLASELAQAYDGIRQQSTQLVSQVSGKYDLLTGVASRGALVETLEVHLAMARRFERPLSIAMFDIDEFARINDERGRAFGDRALRNAARLLNDSIRERDLVARIGGEEFVVAMPGTDLDEALTLAERLRHVVERRTGMTVSVGVAEASSGETQAELLARADVAVNGAKAAGRNQVFAHAGHEVVGFTRTIDEGEGIDEPSSESRDAIAIG